MEAIAKIWEKRHSACLDLQQWHTTCIADILKPTTPWAFRAKLAGQAQGSAQDVEPKPLYEAADNLIRCVEDQRRRGLAVTYSNLKIAIVDAVQMSALVPTAELKQPGQFVCSLIVVSMLFVARGLAHNVVTFRTNRKNCMTFTYYAGPEAVKGLQKFHDKGKKVTKNALSKLDGILLPEFYKKVAEVMQEEKTTLKSLRESIDDIILDQWVSMHLDHPHNGQYVRPEKGVYHQRDVGSTSALVRRTFSISVL